MAIGTFREWLREGEINEATKQQLPDDIMDIFEKKYKDKGLEQIVLEVWETFDEKKKKKVLNKSKVPVWTSIKFFRRIGDVYRISRSHNGRETHIVLEFTFDGFARNFDDMNIRVAFVQNIKNDGIDLVFGHDFLLPELRVPLNKKYYKDLI